MSKSYTGDDLKSPLLENTRSSPEDRSGSVLNASPPHTIQATEKKDLLKMIEQLRKTNKSLEELAYVCAHDLRGPLRNISGFAELLKARSADSLDPMSQEYLHFITHSVKAMQNIVESTLKPVTENQHITLREKVDLEAVLNEVKLLLMGSLIERNVTIQHGSLPMIICNRVQILQLLQNLIQNAIKYTPDAPPMIHIAAVDKGTCWEISVRDNGIGIPESEKQHIFEMFSRANEHRHIDGIGIGLAICANIVAMHGGTMWVTSDLYQGSCFYFTIMK